MAQLNSILSGSLVFKDGTTYLSEINPGPSAVTVTGSLHVSGDKITLNGSDLAYRITVLEAGQGADQIQFGTIALWTASMDYWTGSIEADLLEVHAFSGSILEYTASNEVNIAKLFFSSSNQETRILLLEATGSDHEARLDYLEGKTLVSSSAQVKTLLPGGTVSSSLQISELGFITGSNYFDLDDIPVGIVSSSTQLADDISGSFVLPSSSFSTRVTALENFSSSLDDTYATDLELSQVSQSLITYTDNSITSYSSSNSTTITNLSSSISTNITSISSSLAQDITNTSSSLSSSIANLSSSLATTINNLDATRLITGSVISSVHLSSSIFTITSESVERLRLQNDGTLNIFTDSTSSTAIVSNNVNVGYPTSNKWGENLDGSYFNNFDENTNVSEILRFIAGILSSSAADVSPNTKYWSTVSTSHNVGSTTSKSSLLNGVLGSSYENARLSSGWEGSSYITIASTGSYRAVQDYLISKGFVVNSDTGSNGYTRDTGTNPFHGTYGTNIPGTITTQGTFGTQNFTISANAGGSSAVYSNVNYFGLGTLSSGNANPYYVRVLATQSFSDTFSDQTPDENSTYTTNANSDYSISSFGTTGDGLTLSKIETAQPAVIPAAYQDGDFNNVNGSISGRTYTGGSTAATSISASGYYKVHDVVVGLKSGSQSEYVYKNGSDSSTNFYLYTGDIPSDITSGAPTVSINNENVNRTAFTATSRSLSGAPYLLTANYSFEYSSDATNCFDPGYGYSTTPLSVSSPTDTWENIGSTTLSNTSVSVTNNGVQTNTAARGVLSSDRSTQRTVNEIPHTTDIAFATSSLTFTLDSNTSNVTSARSTQASLNYSLNFRTTARNWKNSSQSSTTSTISLYDATLFNQSSSSGSMAVYSRAQGYDAGSLTGTTETFSGEDYRIQVNNNVVTFSGDAFTTGTFATNDNGDAVLGNYDLQVKPGYLVDPGGSYGYWFKSGFGSGTYKFYIRRFQTSGTKVSMAVNVGKTLVNWNSTSDGVAVAILFKSSGQGSGYNVSLGTARIYDISALTSNVISTGVTTDNHINPFTSNIDLYGNTGGSLNSTTYTVPLRNADGMYLDANDNEYYLLIRYKGDPSPVTSISSTTS